MLASAGGIATFVVLSGDCKAALPASVEFESAIEIIARVKEVEAMKAAKVVANPDRIFKQSFEWHHFYPPEYAHKCGIYWVPFWMSCECVFTCNNCAPEPEYDWLALPPPPKPWWPGEE